MNAAAEPIVSRLAAALLERKQKICTAESCTGGLVAKTGTDLAGASDGFDRGFTRGRSANCNTALPGHFDAAPGRFGARRIPVQLNRY